MNGQMVEIYPCPIKYKICNWYYYKIIWIVESFYVRVSILGLYYNFTRRITGYNFEYFMIYDAQIVSYNKRNFDVAIDTYPLS